VYEEKVDGYRMLAYKAGPRVQILSRHGVDHARRYPDVTGAIAALPVASVVLDGELAVFDQLLRSRFDWLRHRQPADIATPPVLMAFDLLYIKGRDLSDRPLRDRRQRLVDLIADADLHLVHAARRLAPHGLDAWAQVLERGYEGLVAKDDASIYVGGRSRAWLKVKVPGGTDAEDRWRRTLV